MSPRTRIFGTALLAVAMLVMTGAPALAQTPADINAALNAAYA